MKTNIFVRAILGFSVLGSIGMIWSCENSTTTDPTTIVTTDTTTVCFARDVLPIYQANCATSGCHDSRTRQDGHDLSNYTTIMRGIAANNPSASLFYTITASNSRVRMPPAPQAQLTDAQRAVISRWISQGAKNTTCN